MKMKHKTTNEMSGLLMGAAAGAAISAAGIYLADRQNQRQVKRFAKKAAQGVENMISGVEQMMGDYMSR